MGLVYNTKNGTYEYELANKILQKFQVLKNKKTSIILMMVMILEMLQEQVFN